MTKAHQVAVVEALTDLVESARATASLAVEKHATELANAAERIQSQADAARTRFVQDGDEYTSTAWAVIDTCRVSLAETRLRLSNVRPRRYT